MLADIAPQWEQNFLEKGIAIGKQEGISIGKQEGISIGKQEGISIGKQEGISIGKQEGISIGKQEGISIGLTEGVRSVLHDLLRNRFDTLPQDMCASIASMTDTDTLRMLTREVYRVESLDAFRLLLKRADAAKS